MDNSDPNARGLSRHHIMSAVDQSLQRLQTDYIDLYQVSTYISSYYYAVFGENVFHCPPLCDGQMLNHYLS